MRRWNVLPLGMRSDLPGERPARPAVARYGVILADPPWRFEPFGRETGLDRSADNHYPTTR